MNPEIPPDEEPKPKPRRLQMGPDGKRRGGTREECATMSKRAQIFRGARKDWKAWVKTEIASGRQRPAQIIRDLFENEMDATKEKTILQIRVRDFLRSIPHIGVKKAETLLVISQLANDRCYRRLSYLKRDHVRKRLTDALDAWYDQYKMEQRYKRRRDKPVALAGCAKKTKEEADARIKAAAKKDEESENLPNEPKEIK